MEPAAVFVYGTLQQGRRNFHASLQAGWTHSERACILGYQLFSLPKDLARPYSYPAVIPGEGRVWGEVQWFLDLDKALERLDRLEEAAVPGAGGQSTFGNYEYLRVRTEAYLANGKPLPVWVYVYPGLEAVRRAQGILVPSGVWTSRD